MLTAPLGCSPYFSIIIPTFNRADIIGRAIESCLNQGYSNFEVIVIDDGSTDNTVERVEAYKDERIILLKHEANRGVCPARNTGIARARGQWLLMLDSDDELFPGGLEELFKRTVIAPLTIGNVASSCQRDTGIITPLPGVPDRPVDYIDYLCWIDSLIAYDWVNCFRREVFDMFSFPQGRAYEGILHINVARLWKIEISREPLVMVHTDARNRITASPQKEAMQRLLQDAGDCADNAKLLLQEHGQALRKWAPKLYREHLRSAAIYNFLARRREDGLRYSLRVLAEAPTNVRNWVTLLLGFTCDRLLAWSMAYRISRQVVTHGQPRIAIIKQSHP